MQRMVVAGVALNTGRPWRAGYEAFFLGFLAGATVNSKGCTGIGGGPTNLRELQDWQAAITLETVWLPPLESATI